MIEEEEWSKEQEANRKPGQKHPTPSPGFADRVFYESLLQQRPDSRMAQKWCLEYGVLKWAEAEALCKKLGVSTNVTRPAKSPKIKKQKSSTSSAIRRALDESAAAEAMEITSGGFEGVGLGAL
ncbi:hypothetical protein F441_04809 [Phytophthora nicotianae CJ01A1]|uniref:Uncharacterized protein n=6 Tax=Phytophthora nicotianae TaxID=4792 RepID=W2QG61_PHYN3|nr:hypothetical protein PPTG_09071 [Phytophthora nicotianae INRA-310]ETI51940.1 hypothetical protein F443_04811 [Phytophthora nicotianae P1569]ETK91810.1 hypothetical protein L915_04690 [Phytophthora nicotianae]ETO80693.1 hypothetical protein F444_04860 [Phytophthora nicotianae P1976]ETP21731.1 hypothetical protein F441_04809 [Phytophthora nicotianae CJ01A1]ETP49617.1 hypothetical protein F442_04887 [Phytophthora nicotianae P10297]KUF83426.1 hypothetical protein AM587_10008479 [Phytophthora n